MSKRTLKLGLLQHACPVGATVEENLATAERLMRDAAGRGAELLVTQELFTGPYFPQVEDEAGFDLAEPIPGPTTRRLGELARELKVWISASLFERRAAGVYHNTSVMIAPEAPEAPEAHGVTPWASAQITGMYRKMHIPDDPRFYEKYYFTPGDLGFKSHRVKDKEVGMLVCWDQWFPEAARLTAMRGAEVLLYPTAIGYYNDSEKGEPAEVAEAQRETAWHTIQKSHAIANGVYVAAINRIGTERDLTFWGSSFVVAPDGTVIAEASRNEEEAMVVELDLDTIEPQRRGWPFLRDRRIDAYGKLTQLLTDE